MNTIIETNPLRIKNYELRMELTGEFSKRSTKRVIAAEDSRNEKPIAAISWKQRSGATKMHLVSKYDEAKAASKSLWSIVKGLRIPE